jgi:hypothetical protein
MGSIQKPGDVLWACTKGGKSPCHWTDWQLPGSRPGRVTVYCRACKKASGVERPMKIVEVPVDSPPDL